MIVTRVRIYDFVVQDIYSGIGRVSVYYAGFELYRNDSINVCAARFIPCPMKAGEVNHAYTATIPDIAPIGGPYEVSKILKKSIYDFFRVH